MRVDAHGAGAHAFRQTGKLLDGLAFQLQSDQSGGDLCVSRGSIEQGVEKQCCFGTREVSPRISRERKVSREGIVGSEVKGRAGA